MAFFSHHPLKVMTFVVIVLPGWSFVQCSYKFL